MRDRDSKNKVLIGCGVTIIVLIVALAVLRLIIDRYVYTYAQKDYEEKKSELISELDSFIRIHHRLPVSLSEIGLQQNTLSYDIDGAYYVTLIPDDPSDTSYILKYGYYIDSPEYYFSKTGEWIDQNKMQNPFTENDTLKRIDEIKMWMHSDHVSTTTDSIRPNTSISFGYPIWEDDSIVFVNRYKKSNGMSMKGWAVVGSRHLIRYKEFGDWEYRDKNGKTYHKFWNYKKNDSLIYRPDPKPLFIKSAHK